MNLVIALACLYLSRKFPVKNIYQLTTRNIFFLLIVPFFYIRYLLKKPAARIGLNIRDKKAGLFWGASMLFLSLLVSYLIISNTDLSSKYYLPAYAVVNFRFFLVYELIFVNLSLFVYEFFFRGFLLFTLARKFAFYSIPFQAIIYVALLIFDKNPVWLIVNDSFIALVAGVVAYKSRSFVFSYAMLLAYSIILDACVIHLLNK